MKLLVLGASGGCGRWLVRLAREQGHHVRALVRPNTPFDPPAGAEVVRGGVLDEGILDRALDGRDAVLSALGIKRRAPWNPWSALASPRGLTTQVAEQLVELMPRHQIRRLVTISAGGVSESYRAVHPSIRFLIRRSNMAPSYEDLEEMERILASSRLDWMAVRPTTLTNGPPRGSVEVVGYYGLLTRISRGDVAAWMLAALEGLESCSERTPMLGYRGFWSAG